MYFVGIDVGSVAAKAVVLEKLAVGEPRVVGRAVLPTGWNAVTTSIENNKRTIWKPQFSIARICHARSRS